MAHFPRTGTVGLFWSCNVCDWYCMWVIYLGLSETVWLYVRRLDLDPYTYYSYFGILNHQQTNRHTRLNDKLEYKPSKYGHDLFRWLHHRYSTCSITLHTSSSSENIDDNQEDYSRVLWTRQHSSCGTFNNIK